MSQRTVKHIVLPLTPTKPTHLPSCMGVISRVTKPIMKLNPVWEKFSLNKKKSNEEKLVFLEI